MELEAGDAVDGGHQDGGEERADVDDQEFFLEGPGEGEEEEDADGEEDVAAYVSAGLVWSGMRVWRWGGQRVLLLRKVGMRSWMLKVCLMAAQGWECGDWFRAVRMVSTVLFRGEVGGVDGEAGEAGVEGVPVGEAELGGGGVFEDGAGDVLEHAAVEEGGEGGVEEDGEGGGGLLEEEAVGEAFGGAAAEGEDGVGAAEGGGEGGGLEAAEVGLAVVGEELGDGGAGAGFEVGVEVEEGPAECGRRGGGRWWICLLP